MRFGADEAAGVGKKYRISMAVADERGSRALHDYLTAGERNGEFTGLRELPDGVRFEGSTVVVHR